MSWTLFHHGDQSQQSKQHKYSEQTPTDNFQQSFSTGHSDQAKNKGRNAKQDDIEELKQAQEENGDAPIKIFLFLWGAGNKQQ